VLVLVLALVFAAKLKAGAGDSADRLLRRVGKFWHQTNSLWRVLVRQRRKPAATF